MMRHLDGKGGIFIQDPFVDCLLLKQISILIWERNASHKRPKCHAIAIATSELWFA